MVHTLLNAVITNATCFIGARQKARIQALEEMALTRWASGEPAPCQDPSTEVTTRSNLAPSSSTGNSLINPRCNSIDFTAADLFRFLFNFPRDANDVVVRIMAKENFFLRDLVKYGLISLGYAMEPSLFERAGQTASLEWLGAVQDVYRPLEIKEILTAGVGLLAALNNPPRWPSLEEARVCSLQPRISADNIILSPMSYLYAQLLNSQHLGYTKEDLLDYDAVSKFCLDKSDAGAVVARTGTVGRRWGHISPDLHPTEAQMTQEHHPYIDLIPWAEMRNRVLLAAASPDFDEDDFCFDMMHGGLRCWGSMRGSLHGRGEGSPWDARSWEALPWWLEKWGFLAGGEESEVHRNSAWWRAMRGETWETGRGGGGV